MAKTLSELWTDDFLKFKEKVESIFGGSIEIIAEEFPDLYAHQVLSHGFMEYAGIRGAYEDVKTRIIKEKSSFDPDNPEHDKLYWTYLKEEYLTWARQNNLPESLLEKGWKEFCDD